MTAPALPAHLRRFEADGERLLLAIVAVYVLALCLVPLLRLFAEAVLPAGGGPAGGLALMAEVLTSRAARIATAKTLEAALGATALSLILGTGTALLVALTDIRLKTALVFLLLLPLLIPAQISALAWLELMGPSSPILRPLGLAPAPGQPNPLYSREGIILLMGIEHSTMVFLAVRAGLRTIPAELVDAARAAGARPLRVVRAVVLPLLAPAMVAGAALAFVSAIGNFGIPALLGIPGRYPMLTALIYQRLSGFGPSALGEVAVLAMVLAVLAALGLLVQALALRGGVSIAGSGAPVAPLRLGPWRLPVEAAVWSLLVLIAILPLLALVGTSVVQALGVPLTWQTLTLAHYDFVLGADATRRAFANSASLALVAAVASVVVSVPLAYLAASRRHPLARALLAVTDAPFALPGIVLAIACILVFLRPLPLLDIGLYGTLWLILIAYLARFLALGLRPTLAGMAQVDRALDEAARIAGASTLRRLWSIVTPLVAPAAAAGGLLIFMTAFNELTVSALLWSTGHETLGVIVFNLYDEGNATAAAAVAVLTVLATLAAALAAALLARRLPHGVLPWQT